MHYLGNREPPLDELLEDPIVGLMMACDRLHADEVRTYLDAARWLFRSRLPKDETSMSEAFGPAIWAAPCGFSLMSERAP